MQSGYIVNADLAMRENVFAKCFVFDFGKYHMSLKTPFTEVPKNKAAIQLGRKGGKARVSKGPLANKTPEERAEWAEKMVAARKAKRKANDQRTT